MPVPSSFDDLSETPSSNSPAGSESVGTQANEYLQTAFAFIKQLVDGKLKPTATIDFNAQKLTNIANGDTTSSSKDALTGAQVRALAYKVGEVRMWHGAVANIASTWGAGWQLADGTNGTANLKDRFIVGAGNTYAPNATGGNATNTLSVANMPSHNHGINDPGHNHSVNDPGHGHTAIGGSFVVLGAAGGGNGLAGGGQSFSFPVGTNNANTGVSLNASGTGGFNSASGTGISTQSNGSGAAVENRPPYYALCFIEYTGLGA